jgi:SAM-dependent methyltransferase
LKQEQADFSLLNPLYIFVGTISQQLVSTMAESRNEEPVVLIGQTLEVDSAEGFDAESALTDGEQGASLSPTSHVTEYNERHGRRYHAFEEDAYLLPNDDEEIKRLGIQHHTWRLSLNGKLYVSPIPKNVQHVADIGTGAGQWAIEFADQYPSAQVFGTDLSPIQPAWKPANCSFRVENAEEDWKFDQQFDFIHSRMLLGGIHDWPRFFKQAWDHLKPGGWVEAMEVEFPISSADDTPQTDAPLWQFSQYSLEAATKSGLNWGIAKKFKEFLVEQGFVNIRCELVKWPVGTWPKGKKEKEIGRWVRENTKLLVTTIAMGLFQKNLGWSDEQVESFLADVKKDVDDPKKHFYWLM